MKFRSLFPIVFLLLLVSCRKDDTDSLVIKAGFACGWGAGQDDLEITSKSIKYTYTVPQQSSQPLIQESRPIKDEEWNEILAAINIDEFLGLSYNTCNICADGCDEWISIDTDDISHQIKYTKGFKIEEITELQQIISRIKAEFH